MNPTAEPVQATQPPAPPAFRDLYPRVLLIAALHHIERRQLAEASVILSELLALPADQVSPDDYADADELQRQITTGLIVQSWAKQDDEAQRAAVRAEALSVLGMCEGTTPRAIRKHRLRVRTLELRKAGYTRAQICQELNANNWEISTAMSWLQRNGHL